MRHSLLDMRSGEEGKRLSEHDLLPKQTSPRGKASVCLLAAFLPTSRLRLPTTIFSTTTRILRNTHHSTPALKENPHTA